MKNDRRHFLLAAGALYFGALIPARAAAQLEIQQPGALRIAVYADYPPWSAQGRGIDIAIGRALAERMGLRAEFIEFTAGEDMNDDLRNMVWRGHYMGTRPADVMLHVPVDAILARRNEKVKIFAPYHVETMALARNTTRLPEPADSAAALEVFTREKIGVELDSHASDFLLYVLGGRLRNNVTHFRSLELAMQAMKQGEVAAVMGPRAQLEATLDKAAGFALDPLNMPELRLRGWAIGMAVKTEHEVLASALDKAMNDLHGSGELDRIFASHGVTRQTPGGE